MVYERLMRGSLGDGIIVCRDFYVPELKKFFSKFKINFFFKKNFLFRNKNFCFKKKVFLNLFFKYKFFHIKVFQNKKTDFILFVLIKNLFSSTCLQSFLYKAECMQSLACDLKF